MSAFASARRYVHSRMRCCDAVSRGWADLGMPLKPREMSGAGVPAIGVPSWLMLTVPALASALACVIASRLPWRDPGRIHRALRVGRCHRHSHDQYEQRVPRSHHWSVVSGQSMPASATAHRRWSGYLRPDAHNDVASSRSPSVSFERSRCLSHGLLETRLFAARPGGHAVLPTPHPRRCGRTPLLPIRARASRCGFPRERWRTHRGAQHDLQLRCVRQVERAGRAGGRRRQREHGRRDRR